MPTKIDIIDRLKYTDEFLSLKRDCRSILCAIIMAADFDDPGGWIDFPRTDELAAKIEASNKTLHRRVDDLVVPAGLIEKMENTSKIRFTQRFLDLCKLGFTIAEDDQLVVQEREASTSAPPAKDRCDINDAVPPVEVDLKTWARKAGRELKRPRVVLRDDGLYELEGDLEPVTRVNLPIPKWLHKDVKMTAAEHGMTIVEVINGILYKHFHEPD